jgi:arylsulfatase B
MSNLAKPDRRGFIKQSVSASLGLSFLREGSARRPNIIIFVADDLGWNDVGFRGSEIRTPALDRISRNGVVLDRFYSFPLCSPTRAALMTARSPMRTGMIYSVVRPWANYGLPLDERIMPEYFRAAGYQTAIIGKWHLGHANLRHVPNNRGFDHFYGHLNGAIDYWTHERSRVVDWQRNGVTVRRRGYATELLGEEAVRFIENRDISRPFFLYLPFNAPHSPLQAPPETIEPYSGIRCDKRRVFAAMVSVLDSAVDKIMRALRKEGLQDNTIILFFSDNGGEDEFGADNRPLRGAKGTTFEGGLRVPACIHWPAQLPGGRTSSQVMTVLDVLPTLAAAASIDIEPGKPLDGGNLWPHILKGEVRSREDLFFAVENESIHLAVIHGRWKLVQIRDSSDCTVSSLLFDIEADPRESHDIAAQKPDLVRLLTARIERWRSLHPAGGIRYESAPHPGWLPPHDWAAAQR